MQKSCTHARAHAKLPHWNRCAGLVFQQVKARKKGGKGGAGSDATLATPASLVAHVLEDITCAGTHRGFPQLGGDDGAHFAFARWG